MAVILVSACLLGCPCRYDGKCCTDERVLALRNKHMLIPVCPEQLGGLPTPRNPSERRNGGVYMNDGTDVTENYRSGAAAALFLGSTLGASAAVLKSKSPSCGKGLIYDGTFTGNKTEGNGVTAEMLLESGIMVFTEDETDRLDFFLGY